MLAKTSIENYKEINKKLLKLINNTKSSEINTLNEKISRTDWNNQKINSNSEYVKYFIKIIRPYLDKLLPITFSKKWEIDNIWFQQYKKGDFHNWHMHKKTNFSAVYYVELPKGTETKFYNQKNINIKEGDFVIFPGFWYHRSEKIKSKRKTVIAFNCSFMEFAK